LPKKGLVAVVSHVVQFLSRSPPGGAGTFTGPLQVSPPSVDRLITTRGTSIPPPPVSSMASEEIIHTSCSGS
jgi:hypothetical protein